MPKTINDEYAGRYETTETQESWAEWKIGLCIVTSIVLGFWQILSLGAWAINQNFCGDGRFDDPCVTYVEFIISQYHWIVETAGKLW